MKYWIFYILVLISMPVHADRLDDRLLNFSAQQASVAKFVETWSADYLSEPLITTGELTYKTTGELRKTIETPERSVQVIEGDRLTITHNDESRSIELSDEPALAASIYALRGVLKGDRQSLQDRFELKYEEDGDSWALRLTPKGTRVVKKIKVIRLRGVASQIEQVNIQYQNGDSSITKISHDR